MLLSAEDQIASRGNNDFVHNCISTLNTTSVSVHYAVERYGVLTYCWK